MFSTVGKKQIFSNDAEKKKKRQNKKKKQPKKKNIVLFKPALCAQSNMKLKKQNRRHDQLQIIAKEANEAQK